MATYIIIAVIAYAIGSINFSVLISKKIAGFDVREKGSGNAGSTNVLRAVGIKAAVITLICDILKGIVAILIAVLIGNIVGNTDRALLVQIAGILVVIDNINVTINTNTHILDLSVFFPKSIIELIIITHILISA